MTAVSYIYRVVCVTTYSTSTISTVSKEEEIVIVKVPVLHTIISTNYLPTEPVCMFVCLYVCVCLFVCLFVCVCV